MDKGPFDPCNFVCTGWVERDFKSAKKSGSSPDKCPFVRLGRRRSDACLTTWTILLACHLNAGGPVCPAVVHPAKPQRHRYTLCDGALVAAQDRVVDISPATRRITTLQGRVPANNKTAAGVRRAMRRTESSGSRELGNRWSLCGCQENARVPIGQVQTWCLIQDPARTTLAKRSLLCRKFPGRNGKDCLCFALQSKPTPTMWWSA